MNDQITWRLDDFYLKEVKIQYPDGAFIKDSALQYANELGP